MQISSLAHEPRGLHAKSAGMKEILVASTPEEEVPEKFRPEWLADKEVLRKEFEEGKMAYVKWEDGNLLIALGKEVSEVSNDKNGNRSANELDDPGACLFCNRKYEPAQ
jgi:hypothetical protein